MKARTKAHLAVLTTNFIFGINYSLMKHITPSHIKPFGLNMARVTTGLVLFWILYLFRPGKISIQRKHIPRFILCAITGIVFNQLFFVKGLSLTTSIHASLLSLGTPIFITFIAAWTLREKLNIYKIIGLILGVSGSGLLVLMKDTTQSIPANVLLGDLLVLLNAISYAFYMVLVKPLMKEYNSITILRWLFTFGFIIMLPFALQSFLETPWQTFEFSHWLAFAVICVFATFVAYLFNIYGISVIGASATGSYIYTQPVFAAIVAIVLMGEYLSVYKILAAILIFSGVYLVNFKKTN